MNGLIILGAYAAVMITATVTLTKKEKMLKDSVWETGKKTG